MTLSKLKEDLESQYKKALKTLDGEKRAAIKKAKNLKGKKGKEALEQVEQEFAVKLQEIESKHCQELEQLGGEDSNAPVVNDAAEVTVESGVTGVTGVTATVKKEDSTELEDNEHSSSLSLMTEKERKLEKARRKKEKQRQKELEKERELEEIAANAGPNMRVVEMEQIQSTLTPLQLTIREVAADGHCLYRAIGEHTQNDYQQVRKCTIATTHIDTILLP